MPTRSPSVAWLPLAPLPGSCRPLSAGVVPHMAFNLTMVWMILPVLLLSGQDVEDPALTSTHATTGYCVAGYRVEGTVAAAFCVYFASYGVVLSVRHLAWPFPFCLYKKVNCKLWPSISLRPVPSSIIKHLPCLPARATCAGFLSIAFATLPAATFHYLIHPPTSASIVYSTPSSRRCRRHWQRRRALNLYRLVGHCSRARHAPYFAGFPSAGMRIART